MYSSFSESPTSSPLLPECWPHWRGPVVWQPSTCACTGTHLYVGTQTGTSLLILMPGSQKQRNTVFHILDCGSKVKLISVYFVRDFPLTWYCIFDTDDITVLFSSKLLDRIYLQSCNDNNNNFFTFLPWLQLASG